MIEYGIFNDEGCLERQFYTFDAARSAAVTRYGGEDEVTVEALCHDHADDEQPANGCELCE